MKKVFKLTVLCSLLFSFFPVSAQTPLEEYLNAESLRIQQAQTKETEVQSYINTNLSSYSLSQADIDKITSDAQKEDTTLQGLDSMIINLKRAKLRKLYFEQNPEAIEYYQAILPSQTLRQTCLNGDFESGIQSYTFNSTDDTHMIGCETPDVTGFPATVGVNDFNARASLIWRANTLTFIEDDPYLFNNFGVRVKTLSSAGSNGGIKLNDYTIQDQSVTTMSKDMTITDPFLDYKFSFITENPQHGTPPGGTPEDPFFKVSITTATGQTRILRCVTADPGCIFHPLPDANHPEVLYTGWRCDRLDVSDFIGQDVTVNFTVADCQPGGHFSTLYLDDICSSCSNSAFGSLQIDELSDDCASILAGEDYKICGTLLLPGSSSLSSITLSVSQDGDPFQIVTGATYETNGNDFCFTVPASVFTSIANGTTYEFLITASFEQICDGTEANTSISATARVTFTNCACPDVITLSSPTNDVTNNDLDILTLKEAAISVWATNKINPGNNNFQDGVVYTAGEFIELNENFEAKLNSQFAAYIKECPGTFVYRPRKTNNTANEFLSDRPVIIYPNPAYDKVNIVMPKTMFKGISIMTVDGKKMIGQNFASTNKYQADISRFSKGIYIVIVTTDNGQRFTGKLIKN